MLVKQIEVFEFSELAPGIKTKVLDRFREYVIQDPHLYEPPIAGAKAVGKCLGIEMDHVYFSGFSSQGDGACFTGTYNYKADASKAIREYAPLDETLHAIADCLIENGTPGMSAIITHRGRYYHEMSMVIDHDATEYTANFTAENETATADAFRDLAKWIYRTLEEESEYREEVEQLIEDIAATQCEFLADGTATRCVWCTRSIDTQAKEFLGNREQFCPTCN